MVCSSSEILRCENAFPLMLEWPGIGMNSKHKLKNFLILDKFGYPVHPNNLISSQFTFTQHTKFSHHKLYSAQNILSFLLLLVVCDIQDNYCPIKVHEIEARFRYIRHVKTGLIFVNMLQNYANYAQICQWLMPVVIWWIHAYKNSEQNVCS